MILNYIWISLILLAVLMGIVQACVYGNVDIFSAILNSTFDSAKTGFELSLGLTGVLALWMGIMKIGEKAGAVNTLGRAINPFFSRIFPEIPKGHPVYGSMLMNFAANMLGLDNAATPMGLKAMGPLRWTGLISLPFKRISRIFSSTTVQKHQFFGAQLSL